MKTLAEQLIEDIDAFLAEHDLPPTRLGVLAVNDGHFVKDLRKKGNITLDRAERVRAFMRNYRPPSRPRRPSRPTRPKESATAA